MAMNWADWAILAIIGLSALFSLKRGFIKELLSLVTWVAAFIVARLFTQALAQLLVDYIDTPSLRIAAAFAILFVATLLVGALVNALFGALVKATGLSGTDRILGMGFGLARGALVVVVLVALLGMTPAIHDQWWQTSSLIPHFAAMESWSREVAGNLVDAIWHAGR